MIRNFSLKNEKGQIFSLMDFENCCFLSEPSGLGYEYTEEFNQLGDKFVKSTKKIAQNSISGLVNFKSYSNYKKLVDFIEKSASLIFVYKVPYENGMQEYYKDVEFKSITKTEKQYETKCISETIEFASLSLWYKSNKVNYEIQTNPEELRWDIKWDSIFTDFSSRSISFINDGHTEGEVDIKVYGYLLNPEITINVEGNEYQKVKINTEINEGEYLHYSSVTGNFVVEKVGTTTTDLKNVLDISKDNVIRFPQSSCELVITHDETNEISKGFVAVYTYYKSV